jgi:hypothetical protein
MKNQHKVFRSDNYTPAVKLPKAIAIWHLVHTIIAIEVTGLSGIEGKWISKKLCEMNVLRQSELST